MDSRLVAGLGRLGALVAVRAVIARPFWKRPETPQVPAKGHSGGGPLTAAAARTTGEACYLTLVSLLSPKTIQGPPVTEYSNFNVYEVGDTRVSVIRYLAGFPIRLPFSEPRPRVAGKGPDRHAGPHPGRQRVARHHHPHPG